MCIPDLILLNEYGGDWDAYINAVYEQYLEGVVRNRVHFAGQIVTAKHDPSTDGKGYAFWHCVSERGETDQEDDRTIEIARCERVPWIRYFIEKAETDNRLKWHCEIRGTRNRYVIWSEEYAFAVILEQRNGYNLLWTAYNCKSGRIRKFKKDHFEYWTQNSQGPP